MKLVKDRDGNYKVPFKCPNKPHMKRLGMLIKELRSQKYPQCIHAWHQGKAHCAMGIAEVVIARETGLTLKQLEKLREEANDYSPGKWFGVNNLEGKVGGFPYNTSDAAPVNLISLNDSWGLSFEQIGRAVKAQYGVPDPYCD